MEEWSVFQQLLADERREDMDGIPLDLYDDDEEYDKEMEQIKSSYRQTRKHREKKGHSIKSGRFD